MSDIADVNPDQRSPEDVCMCGDYRHQHRDGKFECQLGSLCTPSHCRLFRLCWTADQRKRA